MRKMIYNTGMKRFTIILILLVVLSSMVSAQDELLNSVGTLGASYMYTAFVSIGAIYDGNHSEVYDDDTTIQLLEEMKNLAKVSAGSLNQLLDSGTLTNDDFEYTREIVNALDLLFKEAESYQNFIKTGDEKHGQLYNQYRNSAWQKISSLLGIQG